MRAARRAAPRCAPVRSASVRPAQLRSAPEMSSIRLSSNIPMDFFTIAHTLHLHNCGHLTTLPKPKQDGWIFVRHLEVIPPKWPEMPEGKSGLSTNIPRVCPQSCTPYTVHLDNCGPLICLLLSKYYIASLLNTYALISHITTRILVTLFDRTHHLA
jgi:hypothetical protein